MIHQWHLTFFAGVVTGYFAAHVVHGLLGWALLKLRIHFIKRRLMNIDPSSFDERGRKR